MTEYSVPLVNRISRRIVRPLTRLVFRLLSDVKIFGLENIPKNGSYIITVNHVSIFDPPFVLAFVNRYESLEERLRYFPSLMASLYRETISQTKGFLRRFYQLDREIRLCLTALRAKTAHKDLIREFQFEDPSDPFVAQLIAQKDEKETILPEDYEDLNRVFLENKSEPKKLFRAILQIRFSHIEDLEAGQPFTIDQVLGYLARLYIVEAWDQLDEEKGRSALQEVCR